MATKATKKVSDNAKLDSMEIDNSTRSYQIFAYFEDPEIGGRDFQLKVGKNTDFGKELTAMIEKIKANPRAKVR